MRSIKLTLNGMPISHEVEDNRLLIEFLREDLKLTGTRRRAAVLAYAAPAPCCLTVSR